MFKLTKRRRFILSSLVLTLGLFTIHQGAVGDRYAAIGILSVISFLLTLWSLAIPLRSQVWLLSWILPLLYTVSVSLFYFLLPSSLLALIPILILYMVGMYVLLLSENIFFVTSIRTIQLYRSATAVSFLFTLLTAFLLFDTLFSFYLPFYLNTLFVFGISFLLFLHCLWSTNLEEGISHKIVYYSLTISWVTATLGLVISFWPISISQGSLLLTATTYVLVGLTQAKLTDRLFKQTIREYLAVGLLVLLVTIYSTWWT